jgi:hypothetical protein
MEHGTNAADFLDCLVGDMYDGFHSDDLMGPPGLRADKCVRESADALTHPLYRLFSGNTLTVKNAAPAQANSPATTKS